MPRTARQVPGGICYHVINRGNGRATVFHEEADYRDFLNLFTRAKAYLPMRLLAYCLMPNHFHLVLWPHRDGDLSQWMRWLLTAQVRRHHKRHGGSGRLWQGRYKAFPIQEDHHLLTVLRYVELNPCRAGLAERAETWPWSSAAARGRGGGIRTPLDTGPLDLGADWLENLAQAISAESLAALRVSVNRERPFGSPDWAHGAAERLGLESSFRPVGRPHKQKGAH